MKTQETSILQQQSFFVVKSNRIIQKSRFSMTVQQQKVMLYLISKIKPEDDESCHYQISIRDFCKVCGIDYNNGQNYINVKKAIKEIADKSMWLTLPNGKEVLLRWLNRVSIDRAGGTITVSFHEDMLPFLLDLQERYTQYSLELVLPMKSKYGIRLYELLKSFAHMDKPITFTIDELKQRMDCDKYERFPDFRRYALEKAVEDINSYSDLSVSYILRKDTGSRSYTKIIFSIDRATGIDNLERRLRRDKELSGSR